MRERAGPVGRERQPPGPARQQRLAQPVAAVRRLDVVDDVVAVAVGDRERLVALLDAVVVVVGPDQEARDAGLAGVAHAVGVQVIELRTGGGAGADVERLRADVVLHLRRLRARRARVHPD